MNRLFSCLQKLVWPSFQRMAASENSQVARIQRIIGHKVPAKPAEHPTGGKYTVVKLTEAERRKLADQNWQDFLTKSNSQKKQ